MAEGVDVVKSEIVAEFGVTDIREDIDIDVGARVLRFTADGRHFNVRVSDEFDQDYGTGQIEVDLSQLGEFLRQSKDGKATVRRRGISAA